MKLLWKGSGTLRVPARLDPLDPVVLEPGINTIADDLGAAVLAEAKLLVRCNQLLRINE